MADKDTYQGQGFSGKRMGDSTPRAEPPQTGRHPTPVPPQTGRGGGVAPALLNGLFLAALAAFVVGGIFILGGPSKLLDQQAADKPRVEVTPTVAAAPAPAVVAATPAPPVTPAPVAAPYTGETAPTTPCWHGYWSQDMRTENRTVQLDAYGEPVGPSNPYPAVRSVVIPQVVPSGTWSCIGPENCGYLDILKQGKDGTLFCLAGLRAFPTLDWAGQAP